MKKMMSAFMITFAILMYSCKESTVNSADSDIFKYTNTSLEVIKVYGEGGKEIPQNQWDEETKALFNDYQEQVTDLKHNKYKFDNDKFVTIVGDQSVSSPYKMNGDTVVVLKKISETVELKHNEAILVDDKTLEYHYYALLSTASGSSGSSYQFSESGRDIDQIDPFLESLQNKLANLGPNGLTVVFAGKFHFVK